MTNRPQSNACYDFQIGRGVGGVFAAPGTSCGFCAWLNRGAFNSTQTGCARGKQSCKRTCKSNSQSSPKSSTKKTMNSAENHLDDIAVVVGANVLGWLPTMLEWEELFRLLGLALAAVYTAMKIWDWIQEKRKARK